MRRNFGRYARFRWHDKLSSVAHVGWGERSEPQRRLLLSFPDPYIEGESRSPRNNKIQPCGPLHKQVTCFSSSRFAREPG
jgi:hypothetical protein